MRLFGAKEKAEIPPPQEEAEERAPGTGLPTRAIPLIAGAMAVAAALFVAFDGNNPPSNSAPTQKTEASAHVGARKTKPLDKERLTEIIKDLKGKVKAVTGNSSSSDAQSASRGSFVGKVQITPKAIRRQEAIKANVRSSSIIALRGNAKGGQISSHQQGGRFGPGPGAGAGLIRPVTSFPEGKLAALLRKKTVNDRRQFLKRTRQKAGDSYGEVTRVLPPLKGAVIYPGVVLSATTVTAINTQLPGTVIAQVTNSVYGRNGHVAVPAGSRLVGQYDSQIRNGQTRILIAFERVIFPDGREIVLGNSQATDKQGASGVKADVQTHFMTMLGASLLVSLLDQEVARAGPSQSVASPTGSVFSSPSKIGAQTFASTTKNVLSPYENMQATAVIPPGTAMNVLVNKTIVMPEGQ